MTRAYKSPLHGGLSSSRAAPSGTGLTTAPAAGTGRISRRSVLIGTVIGLPVSALFLWLAVRGLDPSKVWSALADAEPGRVAAAVLAMLAVYLVQAERWRVIARSSMPPLPYRSYLAMLVGGVAVNNVVPGRPGEILRGYWLSRAARAPFGRAFSTVVLDRAADVLALLLFLVASFPFVRHPSWLENLLVAVLVLAAVVVVAIGAAWWYSHRSARGRARAEAGAVHRSRIRAQASAFVRGIAAAVNPRDAVPITLLSLAAWGLWACGAWLVASALGVTLSPLEVGLVTAVINLGTAIPSSPGFIGTYQYLAVSTLGLFGVNRDTAFAFSVLLQASWFIPVTLAGLGVGLWWWAGRGRDLREMGSSTA